jgi:hypothetical protein
MDNNKSLFRWNTIEFINRTVQQYQTYLRGLNDEALQAIPIKINNIMEIGSSSIPRELFDDNSSLTKAVKFNLKLERKCVNDEIQRRREKNTPTELDLSYHLDHQSETESSCYGDNDRGGENTNKENEAAIRSPLTSRIETELYDTSNSDRYKMDAPSETSYSYSSNIDYTAADDVAIDRPIENLSRFTTSSRSYGNTSSSERGVHINRNRRSWIKTMGKQIKKFLS